MTSLLFLEDNYSGRRKYFETYNHEKAIKKLKEWVIENDNREIYLYEIGPETEKQIASGEDFFTSDLETKVEGSRDIWCHKCRRITEGVSPKDLENLQTNLKTTYIIANDNDEYREIHHNTYCTYCKDYTITTLVELIKNKKRKRKKIPRNDRRF